MAAESKTEDRASEVTHDALRANWGLLSEEEKHGALVLQQCEQSAIFDKWPEPGTDDGKKKALAALAHERDAQYPGGLVAYRKKAIELIAAAQKGVNPMEGFKPTVPKGERLEFDSPDFHEYEKIGIEELKRTGVVLLAGGLGERLGFSGVKPALPTEITTGTSFLEMYCRFILSWQKRSGDDSVQLPLAIMVSSDTEAMLKQLMADNANFGLKSEQITWMKQNLMMTLANSAGDFGIDADLKMLGKPGGHGAVHYLMHTSGTAARWLAMGLKWVVFLQDTNGVAPRSLPATVGVSAKKKFVMNSVTVPRLPGEAIGAIVQLMHEVPSESLTINVEYNQLAPLCDATGVAEIGEDGLSIFPGNCNTLVFELECYVRTLKATSGVVPEFINPKFKDLAKLEFKSPARLESMMQDFPRSLQTAEDKAAVGFTQLPKWLAICPVKNNIADAKVKYEKIGNAMSASSGEAGVYYCNRRLLSCDRVAIGEAKDKRVFAGIPVRYGARVVLHPSFGGTAAEIRAKITGKVTISEESTLVLCGDNVTFGDLTLDGALTVCGDGSERIEVQKLAVKNEGYRFKEVATDALDVAEEFRIRGYVLEKLGERSLHFDDGAVHTIDEGSAAAE